MDVQIKTFNFKPDAEAYAKRMTDSHDGHYIYTVALARGINEGWGVFFKRKEEDSNRS